MKWVLNNVYYFMKHKSSHAINLKKKKKVLITNIFITKSNMRQNNFKVACFHSRFKAKDFHFFFFSFFFPSNSIVNSHRNHTGSWKKATKNERGIFFLIGNSFLELKGFFFQCFTPGVLPWFLLNLKNVIFFQKSDKEKRSLNLLEMILN